MANKNSSVGYYYDKKRGKYRARILVNGKRVHLGYYDTAAAAGSAYSKAVSNKRTKAPVKSD